VPDFIVVHHGNFQARRVCDGVLVVVVVVVTVVVTLGIALGVTSGGFGLGPLGRRHLVLGRVVAVLQIVSKLFSEAGLPDGLF
jgi:hypothetical protein